MSRLKKNHGLAALLVIVLCIVPMGAYGAEEVPSYAEAITPISEPIVQQAEVESTTDIVQIQVPIDEPPVQVEVPLEDAPREVLIPADDLQGSILELPYASAGPISLDTPEDTIVSESAVLEVLVPTEIPFVLDPFGINGRGQIYSENYIVENRSKVDVAVYLKSICYTFADQENFISLDEPIEEGERYNEKALYLVLKTLTPELREILVTDEERQDNEPFLLTAYQPGENTPAPTDGSIEASASTDSSGDSAVQTPAPTEQAVAPVENAGEVLADSDGSTASADAADAQPPVGKPNELVFSVGGDINEDPALSIWREKDIKIQVIFEITPVTPSAIEEITDAALDAVSVSDGAVSSDAAVSEAGSGGGEAGADDTAGTGEEETSSDSSSGEGISEQATAENPGESSGAASGEDSSGSEGSSQASGESGGEAASEGSSDASADSGPSAHSPPGSDSSSGAADSSSSSQSSSAASSSGGSEGAGSSGSSGGDSGSSGSSGGDSGSSGSSGGDSGSSGSSGGDSSSSGSSGSDGSSGESE